MTGARISGPRLLEWEADMATAPDGTVYAIFSEQVRGEPRWYEFQIRLPDGRWTGSHGWGHVVSVEGADRLEFDGSTSKRTVMNRAERHAREFHSGRDA